MFSFLRKPVTPPPRNDAAPDDVAIIGLALRLPQSDTLEQFWSNLVEQKSSITEVPAQRWSKARLASSPDNWKDATTTTHWCHSGPGPMRLRTGGDSPGLFAPRRVRR